MRLLVVVGIAVAMLVAPARGEPDCARDADRLRVHLEQASRSSDRWTIGWAIAFGAAAAGQVTLALTETKPFGEFDTDYKETLYVGAAKATLGMLSRIVVPLRVRVPPRLPDRCAELVMLRETLTSTAARQRKSFWLNHLGGFALNIAGTALLWSRRSFSVGAISFAMSYPVGLLSTYTQPRKSWHLWREEHTSWTPGLSVGADHAVLTLTGEL